MRNENAAAGIFGGLAIIAIGLAVAMLPDYYAGVATKMLIYIGLAMAWTSSAGSAGSYPSAIASSSVLARFFPLRCS